MFTTSLATHSSQGIATEGVKGVKENQKTELLLKKKGPQFKGKENKLSKNTLFLFLGESNRIMLSKNFSQKLYLGESFEKERLRTKMFPSLKYKLRTCFYIYTCTCMDVCTCEFVLNFSMRGRLHSLKATSYFFYLLLMLSDFNILGSNATHFFNLLIFWLFQLCHLYCLTQIRLFKHHFPDPLSLPMICSLLKFMRGTRTRLRLRRRREKVWIQHPTKAWVRNWWAWI